MINLITKTKKADIAVTFLVLMTVAVCVLGLFTFATYNNIQEKKILGNSQVSDFHSSEKAIELYVRELSGEVIAELRKSNSLTNEAFSAKLEELLKKERINYFKEMNINISFENAQLTALQNAKGDFMEVKLINFKFTKNYKSADNNINYIAETKDILLEVELKT